MNQISSDEWDQLIPLLHSTGMDRLAFTVTVMCQKYLGLRKIVREDDELPCDELLDFIM